MHGKSAFRVSINYDGLPVARESQMLAEQDANAPHEINTDGAISLKTDFGKVSLGSDFSFELQDAQGKSLIKSSRLSRFRDGFIKVHLDKLVSAPSDIYGAGAKAGSPLRVDHSTPWIVNHFGDGAEAFGPQYYSLTDGYGALMVPASDFSNRTDYHSLNKPVWGPDDKEVLVPDFGKYPANWTSSDDGITWVADGASLDLYLMPASDIYKHLKAHAELTGKPLVPPRYAFGFMASRWGWTDRHYIEDTLLTFRREKFPLDSYISDFEFFGTFNDYNIPNEGNSSYHDFGWNKELYNDPATQLEMYKELGFRLGAIRKPRFGNPKILEKMKKEGWLLPEFLNQALYLDGPARHMNFSTSAAKQWYANRNQHYVDEGMSFWWNDEGEVYYFQYHDWNIAEQMEFNKADPDKRFFSLNRVYTPGLQRLGAAVWTGDIPVSWEALQQQPGYMHNYNLAGNVYTACDTGGFASGANTSSELLARWYWSSAFFTLMRVHSSCTTNGHDCYTDDGSLPTKPHFPFLYGKAAGDAMRQALELRYKMIPMFYSLGHEAYATGAPITRPLMMEFGHDQKAVNIEDQWLVGNGLMTAPVLSEGGKRSVYFPQLAKGEHWFEMGSSKRLKGNQKKKFTVPLDETLVFCRSGTLVPLGPVVQHTGELPGPRAILEMQVYPGRDGSFTLVEDDGESRGYEKGHGVRSTLFKWNDQTGTLSWTVQGSKNRHPSMFRRVEVKLFGRDTSGFAQLAQAGSLIVSAESLVLV